MVIYCTNIIYYYCVYSFLPFFYHFSTIFYCVAYLFILNINNSLECPCQQETAAFLPP